MARQAYYVDSSGGILENVEVLNNVAHDCKGAGFAISVEGRGNAAMRNIRFHHNLLYNNSGTGIIFSRWGGDGLRENIKIYNNTVHHNGHGEPNPGEAFHWITGGLYLFSGSLQTVEVRHNIFSENSGFQIGYSDRHFANSSNIRDLSNSSPNQNPTQIEDVLQQKNIDISHNLIAGPNDPDAAVYAGWPPDNYANIYALNGTDTIVDHPPFIDAASGNFYLRSSPIMNQAGLATHLARPEPSIGAFPVSENPDLWWQSNFPPDFTSRAD